MIAESTRKAKNSFERAELAFDIQRKFNPIVGKAKLVLFAVVGHDEINPLSDRRAVISFLPKLAKLLSPIRCQSSDIDGRPMAAASAWTMPESLQTANHPD